MIQIKTIIFYFSLNFSTIFGSLRKIANSFNFNLDSSIGVPKYVLLPATDFVTPVCPKIVEFDPIVIPLFVPT